MFRYGHHAHHPVIGLLLLVLVAALLVLGVIALVRIWRNHPGHTTPSQTGTPHGTAIDPALNELRIHYARGDINWEEYSQRASNLGYPLPPGAGPGGSPPAGQTPPPAA
jgi:hypothetical protein